MVLYTSRRRPARNRQLRRGGSRVLRLRPGRWPWLYRASRRHRVLGHTSSKRVLLRLCLRVRVRLCLGGGQRACAAFWPRRRLERVDIDDLRLLLHLRLPGLDGVHDVVVACRAVRRRVGRPVFAVVVLVVGAQGRRGEVRLRRPCGPYPQRRTRLVARGLRVGRRRVEEARARGRRVGTRGRRLRARRRRGRL